MNTCSVFRSIALAIAILPLATLAQNNFIFEPPPYSKIGDSTSAPPVLDVIDVLALAFAGRNEGGWNAGQFIREYSTLQERGNQMPALAIGPTLFALIGEAVPIRDAGVRWGRARSVTDKQVALEEIGKLIDKRMARLTKQTSYLIPLPRARLNGYSTAQQGFKFGSSLVLGTASAMRAGLSYPAMGENNAVTAILFDNLSTGRLPPPEYSAGMWGVLELMFLPTPDAQAMRAAEAEPALTLVEVHLESAWTPLPKQESSGPLIGAIGTVNVRAVRILRASYAGEVRYAAKFQ
jgi:hypothetical protein